MSVENNLNCILKNNGNIVVLKKYYATIVDMSCIFTEYILTMLDMLKFQF